MAYNFNNSNNNNNGLPPDPAAALNAFLQGVTNNPSPAETAMASAEAMNAVLQALNASASVVASADSLKRSHSEMMQSMNAAAGMPQGAVPLPLGGYVDSAMISPPNSNGEAATANNNISTSSNKKPAAKTATEVKMPSEDVWKTQVLNRLPRCCAFEGIRESSVFRDKLKTQRGSGTNSLRKILYEITSLEEHLPTSPAIWVRFDEETPQFLRTIITAPTGTPYSLGLFCFDIYLPDNYPQSPPKMQLLTTGGGTVRFSPNLYADGKVCLSLLNTWSGKKWAPNQSTLLQVLVSIQALILGVEHPYYLEPGHGGWEAAASVPQGDNVPLHVKSHEDRLREGTIKYALLETVKKTNPFLQPFHDVITAHFYHYKDAILQETSNWVNSMGPRSMHAKNQLQQAAAKLQEELSGLKALADNGAIDASKDVSAVATTAKAASNSNVLDDSELDGKCMQLAMEEAASKRDFIKAGRLQLELEHMQTGGCSVASKIAHKRQKMDEAAKNGDYITAGELQAELKNLQRSQAFLQGVERRMFDAAAKLDFIRAGRLQEQYNAVMLNSEENSSSTKPAAATNPPSAPVASASMVLGGGGGPFPAGLTYYGKGPPPQVFYGGGGGGGGGVIEGQIDYGDDYYGDY